jgi:hypothetical protein
MFVEPSEIRLPGPGSRRYGRRAFPDIGDYAHALQWDPSSNGLTSSPSVIAGVARHWHTTGQTGCLFARLLARQATASEWPSAVLRDTTADSMRDLTEGLASCVHRPEIQLVSLIFPTASSVGSVKDLVRELDDMTALSFFEDRAVPGRVRVAGRYDIGNGVLAWIMAFGPFESWPATRRGPLLEFVVRTKPKREGLFEKLNQDPAVAHLADIDLGFGTAKTSNLFDGTERATRDVLGTEPDAISAAKTTFSFEVAEWDEAPGSGLRQGHLAEEADYLSGEG